MAVRKILKFGDKTLEKVSKRVQNIDKETLNLIKDLKDTLKSKEDGIGIAAPQIGVLKRVFVIDFKNGSNPIVLINPKITSKIGRQESIEGCLSYPGYEGKLIRPKRVTVEGVNEKGQRVNYEAQGILARCFCHEYDHLDGIIYTKRSRSIKKISD